MGFIVGFGFIVEFGFYEWVLLFDFTLMVQSREAENNSLSAKVTQLTQSNIYIF